MEHTVETSAGTYNYELQMKKVKNINLRITKDGKITVSAHPHVPQRVIDDFLRSKADWIVKVLARREEREKRSVPYYTEKELRETILKLCEEAYPYYEKRGISYPEIRFRRMVSQWGNCRATQKCLTFNLNLMYAPPECVFYVVWHEFTHLLEQNHSDAFYKELEKVCPDWKMCRKKLKEVVIP